MWYNSPQLISPTLTATNNGLYVENNWSCLALLSKGINYAIKDWQITPKVKASHPVGRHGAVHSMLRFLCFHRNPAHQHQTVLSPQLPLQIVALFVATSPGKNPLFIESFPISFQLNILAAVYVSKSQKVLPPLYWCWCVEPKKKTNFHTFTEHLSESANLWVSLLCYLYSLCATNREAKPAVTAVPLSQFYLVSTTSVCFASPFKIVTCSTAAGIWSAC